MPIDEHAIDFWAVLHKPDKHWVPFFNAETGEVLFDDPDLAAALMTTCATAEKAVVSINRKMLMRLAMSTTP